MPRTQLGHQKQLWLTADKSEQLIEIIDRARDTNGTLLRIQVTTWPDAWGFNSRPGGPPVHLHQVQQETFRVKNGTLHYLVNGKHGVLRPGDPAVTVLPGQAHTQWNPDKEHPVTYIAETTVPPGQPQHLEYLFQNLAGLGQDYGALRRANYLQLLLVVAEHDFILPQLGWAWEPIKHTGAAVARMLGYKASYPEYVT
jgi:mannose-6-phosphate isomerase-like protein (cupin superfamily)